MNKNSFEEHVLYEIWTVQICVIIHFKFDNNRKECVHNKFPSAHFKHTLYQSLLQFKWICVRVWLWRSGEQQSFCMCVFVLRAHLSDDLRAAQKNLFYLEIQASSATYVHWVNGKTLQFKYLFLAAIFFYVTNFQ